MLPLKSGVRRPYGLGLGIIAGVLFGDEVTLGGALALLAAGVAGLFILRALKLRS